MKTYSNHVNALHWSVALAWSALMMVLTGTAPTSGALVTIWEDQFTSISPEWQLPAHGLITLDAQPVPNDVVGSEDGFEARFNSRAGSISDIYITRTIPADLVQAGDRVEYAIRTDYPTNYAADRINLVAPVGGTDFDSGFVGHDSPGGLEYKKEPGTFFDLFDTTLLSGLREAGNLWFGNNGWGGAGVDSIFYVDYIRIVGERTVLPGDYNSNGTVDAADYVVWRNGDSPDDSSAGYDLWKANFGKPPGAGGSGAALGAVPEPAAACLVIMGILIMNSFLLRPSRCFSPATGG